MAWDNCKSEKRAEVVSGMKMSGRYMEVYFHLGVCLLAGPNGRTEQSMECVCSAEVDMILLCLVATERLAASTLSPLNFREGDLLIRAKQAIPPFAKTGLKSVCYSLRRKEILNIYCPRFAVILCTDTPRSIIKVPDFTL